MDAQPAYKKLRRLSKGGRRAPGREKQREFKRIKRKNPKYIHQDGTEPTLTSCAGLLPFARFSRAHGVEHELSRRFDHMKPKSDPMLVYSMSDVLRTILDAQLAGESRVFGLENLSADPLFRLLAGGDVFSIDTGYRDLARFDDAALASLEELMADEALKQLRSRQLKELYLDLDSTVEPLFGEQIVGARPGPNPRYHGRPSYHPLILRAYQLRLCVGAQLRPGDTAFGNDDVPIVRQWLRRVREAVGPDCHIYLRMDCAGDCTSLLKMLQEEEIFFIIKAKLTPNLCAAISKIEETAWVTVDVNADLEPTEQAAVAPFARAEWASLPVPVRVVAVRSELRKGGHPYLWEHLEFSARAYLTCDPGLAPEDVAKFYDDRAAIEPYIGEQKADWGIGEVPTQSFEANHALFLLKLYASNLWAVFVKQSFPAMARWRTSWQRRVLLLIPGRVILGGNQVRLRLPEGSPYHTSSATG